MAKKFKYKFQLYRGRKLDKHTIAALEHAEDLLGSKLSVSQGSYNTSVGASAGTHARGGSIDCRPAAGVSYEEACYALRQAGWAAWIRPTVQGLWNKHIHAVLLGHPDVAPGASSQRQDYMIGRDGLAGHGKDPNRRLPWRITSFKYPLSRVSLSTVTKEAKKRKGWHWNPSTVRVQRVLNKKMGSGLKADGKFGPVTKKAYKRFEVAYGAAKPDGVPGKPGLTALGASRFIVVK